MPRITRLDGRPCGVGHLRVAANGCTPAWQLCECVRLSAGGLTTDIVRYPGIIGASWPQI
jgi:hypothetical protein